MILSQHIYLPESTFRSDKFGEPIAQPTSKSRLRLHTYLHSFKGAESHISNHLSRSRPSKVYQGLVLLSILRPCNIWVVLLEELIESKLASSLSTVTKQGGHPSPEGAPHSLLLGQNSKPGCDALVFRWIDLQNKTKMCYYQILNASMPSLASHTMHQLMTVLIIYQSQTIH